MILSALALAAALVMSAEETDPPAPVRIEEWSADKITTMGKEMYRHDRAAWLATDVFLAYLDGTTPEGIAGWIVEPHGDDLLVRFLVDDASGTRAGWDILVGETGAGEVAIPEDVKLSEDSLHRFHARQTAIANVGDLICSRSFNTVVLEDPDSDGWLVWLLAATDEAGVIPVGGHYRFRISADGAKVEQREQLSAGCLNMQQRPASSGEPAALFVSQIVSDSPVETHVFLALLHRMPLYVMADSKIWVADGTGIRVVER